jgi:hypothetical protein
VLQPFWPRPLRSRSAGCWLRSLIADFAVVAFNWLVVEGTMVKLHAASPQVRLFEPSNAFTLVGTAVLQAVLITLFGYSEGLYDSADLRRQADALAKSVALVAEAEPAASVSNWNLRALASVSTL